MQIGHLLSLNWNRFWPGDWIDGEQVPQRSLAHGDDLDPESKKKFGVANAETGRITKGYLDWAFAIGVVQKWFHNFQGSDNFVLNFLNKTLASVSSTLEAKRDELIYGRVYGTGLNSNLTDEEILDQRQTLDKLPFIDDWLENKRQKLMYGERVVPKVGKYATRAARIKPIAQFISGFLGHQYRMAVETLLDIPARFYWRIRFFGNSLHANFATTAWDLMRLGTMSIFNQDAKNDLTGKIQELKRFSETYFEKKYEGKYVTKDKSSLGLYFSMLKDRVSQHWSDIFNAKKVFEEKKKKGLIKDSDNYNEGTQFYSSITDFTAPFCAGLGLLATTIFDPLKVIWGIAGFEKGKYLINALSASRKTFQLINYIPRFIIPELLDSSKIHDKKEYSDENITAIKNGSATAATQELHHARSDRNTNALIGMTMAIGNIIEPIGHFFRAKFEENKFASFLFDCFTKFNDDFLVRFFSARRETRGRIAFIKALLKLEGKKDTSELQYSQEELQGIATNEYESMDHMKVGTLEPVFTPLSKLRDNIAENLKGITPIKVKAVSI